MNFRRYQSRPITRLAHEITERDVLTPVDITHTRVRFPDGESITFAHHEDVQVGDFIVFLTQDDTYHCARDVFLERNIVPGDPDE